MADLFGYTPPPRHRHGPPEWLMNLSQPTDRQAVSHILHDRANQLRLSDTTGRVSWKIDIEADRFENCKHQAVDLQCPDCRKRYFVPISCRSRICPTCAWQYSKMLQDQIVPLIREVNSHKRRGYVLALLTLTVTSKRYGDELPDREGIKRLYRETSDFLRLHYGKYKAHRSPSGKIVEDRSKGERIHQGAGWIATLEFGKDNNNAHCHAIVYGPYISQGTLKKEWSEITGDSFIVDIRAARGDMRRVSEYVLKYITKPPNTESYDRVADYSLTIKGSRRLRTGGIFYNRIKNVHTEKSRCACIFCNARLLFSGYLDLDGQGGAGDRLDLFAELRSIERERN